MSGPKSRGWSPITIRMPREWVDWFAARYPTLGYTKAIRKLIKKHMDKCIEADNQNLDNNEIENLEEGE